MLVRWSGIALVLAMAACSGERPDGYAGEPAATMDTVAPAAGSMAAAAECRPQERMAVEGRASAYDSTVINIGGAQAKVCYGRPQMRERTIYGGLVPYDTLWRTGANEPTIIHLPVAATIAGIRVDPGSYSIYTVPGQQQWTVVVNRSIDQWGHEGSYTPEVRAQEVGRAQVPAERTASPVETFTISSEDAGGNAANMVLEWENTRVAIPIRPA
jgi:hypothetical protein